MHKDEVIKDLKRDYKLCVTCEMFNGWVDDHGNIHDPGCLEYHNCDCNATDDLATVLFKADYRKVTDDEVVIKKSEYEALLLEQKRLKEMVDRIPCGYVQKEEAEYWKSRCKEIGDVASNETARDILQELAIYAEEDDNGQVTVDWYHLETLAERYEFYLER